MWTHDPAQATLAIPTLYTGASKMKRILLVIIAAWLSVGLTALAAQPKRLLLIGQGPDGHPPGTHEYMAGQKILQHCLKPVDDISTEVVSADEPWSDGPEKLKHVDGVVIFVSEGAKWASADQRRLQALAGLASRGGAIIGLHWGIGCKEAAPIPAFLSLLGGCHGGPDRKYQVLQKATLEVAGKHPITTGLKDFATREELYYQLKFVNAGAPAKQPTNAGTPAKQALTPILQSEIDGAKHTVSWAWQRPDGGRSFGFSGLHFHDNWQKPEYRRLVTQAVLWSFDLPVPEGGVNVDVPKELLELK
jgi:type 1 glutamine amidotransferase